MDLEYLLSHAAWFAYEYRKFFPIEEMPIAHYVSDDCVVVISTHKLCVFYYDVTINYTDDKLLNTSITNIDENLKTAVVSIKDRSFNIHLPNKDEFEKLIYYYNKYKK